MSARCYVAAKAPRPGLAKTRLAHGVGEAGALALYRAFLRDLAARLGGGPVPLGWFVTPDDGWPEVAREVGGAPGGVVPQGDGSWTDRQRRLFRDGAGRGETRTVLIASDSPHVRREVVEGALRALDRADVVLGPTRDGGYYLIGMRGWHDVLAGVTMSTDRVLDGVLDGARRCGARVALVEETFDVDEADDLALLERMAAGRHDMEATRAALAALGLGAAA